MPRQSTTYKLAGTDSFRLASTQILKHRNKRSFGDNLQNKDKKLSKFFIPDEGKEFFQADQSGAEALIVAYLCELGKYREIFLNGIKPHVYVAIKFFPEIWRGEGFSDIDEISAAPIAALKSLPRWKELDTCIKATDKWEPSRRYYYMAKRVCHCVDEKTEVLTKEHGWISCKQAIENKNEIAIWNGNISFELPIQWNSDEYEGPMFRYKGKEIDQLITPNHKVIYSSNNKIHATQALNLLHTNGIRIPVNGTLLQNTRVFSDDEIKLICAIQADGWIVNSTSVRFHFRKNQKINRLRTILQNCGHFVEPSFYDDGTCSFYVNDLDKYIEIITNDKGVKCYNKKFLQLSIDELKILIKELPYWDGAFKKTSIVYRTAIEENAIWIKTICHLTGQQAVIWKDKNCYRVGLNKRSYGRLENTKKIIQYKGFVYCPTVSTGAFLVRRNGYISVTGNSGNYGIQAPELAINILKDSEGQIKIPLLEMQRMLAVYHGIFPEIKKWNQAIQRQLEQTRTLRNLFGYPRKHYGPITNDVLKQYYAWIPQSTVGVITHKAIVRMQDYIEEANKPWDVLSNKHDSYLLQVPIGENPTDKMQEFMEQDLLSPRGEKFKMRSETQRGFSWGDLH